MDTTGLSIEDLHKSYGSRKVLDGVSFTVRPGEMFGFVGANGSGKTTTMRIAVGVLASDSGTVSINGQPLDARIRRCIGYMPEERGLYPKEKVARQLVYFAQLHGMSSNDAQRRTAHYLDMLGLSERANDKVESLSLGNQQRVQLAAALVHDPSILILDEPFSGLDPVAVSIMADVLRGYVSKGVPVIFSSHQLDLVERLCDRVGILKDGRMLAQGTIQELRSRGGRRIEISCDALPSNWEPQTKGITGVEYSSIDSSTRIISLAEDAEPDADQQLLREALSYGAVTSFGPALIPLTQLFQEAVTA